MAGAPGKAEGPQPRARVVAWLDALAKAGPDMEAAKRVLNSVKNDERASKTDREHFYKALAQQSLVWFMGALEGRPLSNDEVKALAKQVVSGATKT